MLYYHIMVFLTFFLFKKPNKTINTRKIRMSNLWDCYTYQMIGLKENNYRMIDLFLILITFDILKTSFDAFLFDNWIISFKLFSVWTMKISLFYFFVHDIHSHSLYKNTYIYGDVPLLGGYNETNLSLPWDKLQIQSRKLNWIFKNYTIYTKCV